MTIHKEGMGTIIVSAIALILLCLAAKYFLPASLNWVFWLLVILSVITWLFIISFFRIPRRDYNYGAEKVTSPCDGKVVVIEETVDEEYFKEKKLQISIFMSPANVHVNRNPVDGKVIYSQYHKGKYLVAWHPKSSLDNERHTVVYDTGRHIVLAKQIAGALARRIVNYLKVGDVVKQNEEMGFIKFGSRVDLILPLDAQVKVKINDLVKGGITTIAELI